MDYKARVMKRLFGDSSIVNKRDSIDGDLLHVESAAKNTLRVCGDIAQFYKNGKIELIIDKCEDIEEFGQKILKFCKRIEVEARKQVK